ncbi:spore gernimation protein GerD [Filobacillus milosensis]|uniref:Spore gernimation protein GerD n=1 Tax=Filobacillus milosensis TaxID=94137 RepID=A0A4Y8ILA4_9BACI|nr:spore germination lipoprotein GerD [Filobacillus milosensis]TFB14669.1 spore gernimation protein GerD [Filobacillus milosensis]
MKTRHILILIFIMLLTACTQGGGQSKQSPEYEATKKMVVDILKTDDGKKAVKEILTEEEMKQQLVINSDVVKKSVEQLTDEKKGKEFWTKMFEDPSFVQTYVQATKEANEKLIKGLMNDSTYQAQMLQLFQNEEMQKMLQSALKSQQFREHLEKTIQETLNSPLFKARMTEVLLKAAEEQQKSQGGGQGQDQQQQSGGGGGQSGGSSSGGGGGS